MGFQIYWGIDNEDTRSLELISQANGFLQVLKMNPDWAHILERRARIEETVASLGIEGTVISKEQARAITTGDTEVNIGEKEKREFEGYFDALEYIKKCVDEKFNLSMLLGIHQLVTRGDDKAAPGKVRVKQNYVKTNGRVIYTPPPPDQLNYLLRDFFDWYNKTAEDKMFSPVIAAGICHFWFVWIHPFNDGNGRVSRVLTTLMLQKKKSEGVRYFAISDFYNKYKDLYYDALEKTNLCNPKNSAMNFDNKLDIWLKFFISSYLEQMNGAREICNRILQFNIRISHLRKQGLLTESHDKLLTYLTGVEKASYTELAKSLKVSKPRIHQIVSKLREAEILVVEEIGKEKWFRLGSPEDNPHVEVFKPKLNSKTANKTKNIVEKPLKQAVLPIFED